MPGIAPWLQEAPLKEQVHARYLKDIRRQLVLVSDDIDLRLEHEVPALRAGRALQLDNLGRARDAAAASGHAGRAYVLQLAVRRTQQLSEHEAKVLARVDNLSGVPARGAFPGGAVAAELSDDDASVAEADHVGAFDTSAWQDGGATRDALQLVAQEDADAAENVPFEPVQQGAGEFPLGVNPGAAADPAVATCPADGSGFVCPSPVPHLTCSEPVSAMAVDTPAAIPLAAARHGVECADLPLNANLPDMRLVATLEEAGSAAFAAAVICVHNEHGVASRMMAEDFQSLLRDEQLTTGVVDHQSVLLQVRLPFTCTVGFVTCIASGIHWSSMSTTTKRLCLTTRIVCHAGCSQPLSSRRIANCRRAEHNVLQPAHTASRRQSGGDLQCREALRCSVAHGGQLCRRRHPPLADPHPARLCSGWSFCTLNIKDAPCTLCSLNWSPSHIGADVSRRRRQSISHGL